MRPQIPKMNGMNENEQFFQSSRNVPKPFDLGWYRSNKFPAKFGGPETSRTDTKAWLHFCPNLAPKSRILWDGVSSIWRDPTIGRFNVKRTRGLEDRNEASDSDNEQGRNEAQIPTMNKTFDDETGVLDSASSSNSTSESWKLVGGSCELNTQWIVEYYCSCR